MICRAPAATWKEAHSRGVPRLRRSHALASPSWSAMLDIAAARRLQSFCMYSCLAHGRCCLRRVSSDLCEIVGDWPRLTHSLAIARTADIHVHSAACLSKPLRMSATSTACGRWQHCCNMSLAIRSQSRPQCWPCRLMSLKPSAAIHRVTAP